MRGIFSPDPGYQSSGPHRSVERYSPIYDPASTTEVNYSRLPPVQAFHSMSLSHAQDVASEDRLILWLRPRLLRIMVVLPLLIFICLAASGVLSDVVRRGFEHADKHPTAMLYLLGGALLLFLCTLALYTSRGPQLVTQVIIVPISTMVLLVVLKPVLADRPTAVKFALAVALLFLLSPRWGLAPFYFHWRWLRCHPAYTKYRGPHRELLFHIVCFVEAAIGVAVVLSTTLSVSSGSDLAGKLERTVALSVFSMMCFLALGFAKQAERMLAHYLTYGEGRMPAPGTWSASTSVRQRRRAAVLTFGAFTVLFALNFGLYLTHKPLFQGQVNAGVEPAVVAIPEANDETFKAFQRLYARLSTERSSKVLPELAVACAITVIVPLGLIPLVYALPLLHLRCSERWLSRRAKNWSTHWEAYASTIRTSRHEAKEPLGSVVREADHLFLGTEPVLSFPILLDQALLTEHVYIAGDSGSGKTSMCIMPLMIQLIRGREGWKQQP